MNEEKKVEIASGKYFMKSTEMCLIGYKSLTNDRVEFRSKIANDIIVSDIKKNCQKPKQLYTIIDLMMPGSKKVEIFAKNNNLKSGWLSMGNELGERFLDSNKFSCAKCSKEIQEKRYKDLCSVNSFCTKCKDSKPNLLELEITNTLHSYHYCSVCSLTIIGIRFQCSVCESCNLCESN